MENNDDTGSYKIGTTMHSRQSCTRDLMLILRKWPQGAGLSDGQLPSSPVHIPEMLSQHTVVVESWSELTVNTIACPGATRSIRGVMPLYRAAGPSFLKRSFATLISVVKPLSPWTRDAFCIRLRAVSEVRGFKT